MRTTQRDQAATTTFGAAVSDAPSGSGVAQPGSVPFTFTRTGTGVYAYRFDTRLMPVTVNPTANSATGHSAATGSFAPGAFNVTTLASNAPANGSHYWSCTALDKRT